MITYPNQKVVTVRKAKSNKENLYGIVNLDAAKEASKNLKAGAFRLWVFFTCQQDSYTFALSRKHLHDEWGINKSQYTEGVKELKECGYLVPKNESESVFEFSEMACTENRYIPKIGTPEIGTPEIGIYRKPAQEAAETSEEVEEKEEEIETEYIPCTENRYSLYRKSTQYVPEIGTPCTGNQTRNITYNKEYYNNITEDEIDRMWAFNQPNQEKKKAHSSNDFSF